MIRLLCLLALLSPLAWCNDPGGGPATGGADVTLTDSGSSVTLANGSVTATIDKASAEITSLLYNGVQCVRPGGNIYYSLVGTGGFRTPSGATYSVVTNTTDMVEISMIDDGDATYPFDLEVHYILRRGDTGVYTFINVEHPAAYPTANLSDFRLSWKMPNDTFEKLFVDDLRSREMPSAFDYSNDSATSIAEVTHLNTGVLAGQDEGKYCYSTAYHKNPAFGHASDSNDTGAWVVTGGTDFLNDGPFKKDLAPADRFIHFHFGRNHYDGSTINVDTGTDWSKLYGPFLLYFNTDAGGADACWADAKAQAEAEAAAWPYGWMTHADYPLSADRGTVTGTINLNDSLKPSLDAEGAWIGLADPDAGGNFQYESLRYQTWAKVGPGGSFTIPDVRPGTYTLYCVAEGVAGEYEHGSTVNVTAGGTINLGTINWNVSRSGSWMAWEIGVADRDSLEFANGDNYWIPFAWDFFTDVGDPRGFPNPLTYTVGTSTASDDWNYCQSIYGDSLGATGSSWPYQVSFDLASVPASGNALLHIAFSGSHYARMHIDVNGSNPISSPGFFYVNNSRGNGLIRQSSSAKYAYHTVEIPVSMLNVGANTIQITEGKVDVSGAHVMYDYVGLELPTPPGGIPTDGDGDGLVDNWEQQAFKTMSFIGTEDPDGDGFDNEAEETAGTDPNDALSTPDDGDADGLADTWELANFGNLAQTGTDDPDSDGFDNETEETAGSDPNNGSSVPSDTDGDGLDDMWELANFGDLSQSGTDDPDSDGYTNEAEETAGSDPNDGAFTPDDADGDGLADAWENANFSVGAGPYGPTAQTNSATFDSLGSPTASHTFSNFNLNGGNCVVVALDFETVGGIGNYSITYGGEALTLAQSAVDNDAGAQTSAVFYLLNPSNSVANLVISTSSNDGFAASAIALSGVAGIGSTGSDGDQDPNYSLTLNYSGDTDDFLVISTMENAYTAPANPAISGDNTPLAEIQIVNGGSNSDGGCATWAGPVTSAGSSTTTVSVNSNSTRHSAVAVVFDSLPLYADPLRFVGTDDPDSDGFDNEAEESAGTDPNDGGSFPSDTDGDGLFDSWEITHFGNLSQTGTDDPDSDGFDNEAEETVGTDPNDAQYTPDDTDGDGLADAWEIANFGSLAQDGTGDADADGFDNEAEETAGSDPNNGASTPDDTDGDGLADTWEIANFGDLSLSGTDDPDSDGFDNETEETAGSDPDNGASTPADTDGDGLADAWEIANFGNLGQSATDDADSDGFDNESEETAGTDPNDGAFTPDDTDGDGLADAWEVANFSSVPPVSQTNTASTNQLGASVTSHTFPGFALNGGNAVVVALTFETTGGLGNYTVTYGAEPLTLAISAVDNVAGAQTSAIYYLLNPASSSADLVITTTAADNFAVSAVALADVTSLGSTDGAGGGAGSTLNLTYTATTGGFLVITTMDNTSSGSTASSLSGANTPLTQLQVVPPNGQGASGAWAGPINAGGTTTVTSASASTREAAVAAVFDAASSVDPLRFTGTDDPDSDGFDNETEESGGSDPNDAGSTPGDSDLDGLDDAWEITHFGNLSQSGTDDPDSDGFNNEAEETAGTDPNDSAFTPDDTDGDGLADAWELANFGDLDETGTGDPDSDGFDNEAEETAGTAPNDGAYTPDDTDGDGLADAWETTNFGDLSQDASGDADNDGTENWLEEALGYDPNSAAEYFKATIEVVAPGNIQLTWPNAEGVTFTVECATTSAPAWTVDAVIVGSASPATLSHATHPGEIYSLHRVTASRP